MYASSSLREGVEVGVGGHYLRGESMPIKIFQNQRTHDIETFSPFWKPAASLLLSLSPDFI
jgi:hypothetical protein